MQIKATMRYHLTPAKWPSLIRLQITSAGDDVEKREPSYTVDGDLKGKATMENSMEVPQITKYRTTI